jgi:hypothetical protein
MALDASGKFIWATTGGGPLVKLDATTGAILAQFGDRLTQSLAIQSGTGLIYISSGSGIEVFDPASSTFSHFSDIRVGSLGFAPDGSLWAATWPHNQSQIIRFSGSPATPQLMLQLNADVDSIAFGLAGSSLEGLLFISHTDEASPGSGSDLTMVDLSTMRQVALATGGTRGDEIKAGADGRLFISQSHQIDVLNPIRSPRVASTNPPPDMTVALPFASITVTFDNDMLASTATDPHSVLNPNNYQLLGDSAGLVVIRGVSYDKANRTAVLSFDPLYADRYQLQVLAGINSSTGLGLAESYSTRFTAIADLTSVLGLQFSMARSDRANGTVSFDVSVTNTGQHRLLLPIILQLTPVQHFDGEPLGANGRSADGSWLIDLNANLPSSGILEPGQSTSGRTVSVLTTNRHPVAFDPTISGVSGGNNAPVFDSNPLIVATVGQVYSYQATASDINGDSLSYLLVNGPSGMTVDAATGVVTWTPSAASTGQATVALQVYDTSGAYDMQSYTLQVDGVNSPPVFFPLDNLIQGREGQSLQIPVVATDADADNLVYWAEHLPPGALFDPLQHALVWTPDFHSAGTYTDVRFLVSDGLHQVSESTTVVIAPTPQAPTFLKPAVVTVR